MHRKSNQLKCLTCGTTRTFFDYSKRPTNYCFYNDSHDDNQARFKSKFSLSRFRGIHRGLSCLSQIISGVELNVQSNKCGTPYMIQSQFIPNSIQSCSEPDVDDKGSIIFFNKSLSKLICIIPSLIKRDISCSTAGAEDFSSKLLL
uniref:Uncharacterized protein n=1 Tax=Romanomermis culicivorax TaxID=13658 RepID=A0A915L1F1_ROMCU